MRTSVDEALLDAAEALMQASRRSGKAVLETLAARIGALELGADAMLVFQPQGEQLHCIFAAGPRAQYYRGAALCIDGESLPSRAFLCGCHVADHAFGSVLPTDRAAIAVPLRDDDSIMTIVCVCSAAPDGLKRNDPIVRAVALASSPYAIALEREADRATATFDGLTGLHTPRAFREILQAEIRDASLGKPMHLALWFIDTDGFKSVNDTLGHAAGDTVLQQLAALLRRHLDEVRDLGARNGGDEFCALVRGVRKAAAIERAQDFCDAVRACDFHIALPITASVGVAAYPSDASGAGELLEIADSAMYHSKRSGRDRVAYCDGPGSFTAYR